MQKQSLTTCCGQTDAQPVPKQKMADFPKPHVFPFVAEHDVIWYGTALWLVQVILPAVSSHSPVCSLGWQSEKQRRP